MVQKGIRMARNMPLQVVLPTRVIEARQAAVLALIVAELERVRQPGMYPGWQADLVHAAAIASEESGEVVKAVNDYAWEGGDALLEEIFREGIQAAAMWVRFLVESPSMEKVGRAKDQ